MKQLDEEVLEILNQTCSGLSITRITEILRLKHRCGKYRVRNISDSLRKLEKKGLVSRGKTEYNITVWTTTKTTS